MFARERHQPHFVPPASCRLFGTCFIRMPCGIHSARAFASIAALLPRSFPLKKFPHIPQHLPHHPRRQFPRKSILLAGMIRRKKPRASARQLITRPMPERKRRKSGNLPAILQQPEIRPHRNIPEYQHRSRPKYLKLPLEIRATIRRLRRQRLIRRRRAANRCSDVCIFQRKSVASLSRRRLIRKSRPVKRRVQKISRPVAGKNSSCPVATMRRRSKSQNQQLRLRISKSRHRLAPVLAPAKRQSLFPRHPLAVFHQPRTLPAPNDLLVQRNEQLALLFFSSLHSSSPQNATTKPSLRPAHPKHL